MYIDCMKEETVVRGLPEGTKEKYRKLAAQMVLDGNGQVSMNSLYVKAIMEYMLTHSSSTTFKDLD